MSVQDTITVIGVSTGLVGATAALLSSLIGYLTFRHEGYIIKVVGKRGWKLINAIPPYSEDKRYSVITVYNRGRRLAHISKVGESYLLSSGGSIYSDSMIQGATQVDEDGARDYLGEENPKHPRPTTGYYYAVTRSGRMFKYYPHTRFAYWLCYPVRKANVLFVKAKKTRRKKV